MARHVDRSRYDIPPQRPALKPVDVGGEAEVVLTVEWASERTIPDGPRDRIAIMVAFAEYPDFYWWPGFRDCGKLLEKLGDDLDLWPKQVIPLAIVERTHARTGAPISQLGVAPDWDKAIAVQMEREAADLRAKARPTRK